MTDAAPSPWSRPAPGQPQADVVTPSPPEVLATPVAPPPAVIPLPDPLVPTERHPADPDKVPSSKAWAVLALGIVGILLMFCGGGLVPGLSGLILVRPARAELGAAAGFLTGGRVLRAGEILSWIAVAVSAVVIVAVVIGLLIGSVGSGPQYDENVN